MTNQTLLRKLHQEYRTTDAAFDKHIKKQNCTIDGTCLVRARFQERLATLDYAIRLLGGKQHGTYTTTIEDW